MDLKITAKVPLLLPFLDFVLFSNTFQKYFCNFRGTQIICLKQRLLYNTTISLESSSFEEIEIFQNKKHKKYIQKKLLFRKIKKKIKIELNTVRVNIQKIVNKLKKNINLWKKNLEKTKNAFWPPKDRKKGWKNSKMVKMSEISKK